MQNELEKPQWIIDGNFNRTIRHRLNYCDTVFFFDLPTITCLIGITKRILLHYGRAREDMGGNCVECFDAQKRSLYRNVLTFNTQHRQDYYTLLAKADHASVIVFRSHRQVRTFLKSIELR